MRFSDTIPTSRPHRRVFYFPHLPDSDVVDIAYFHVLTLNLGGVKTNRSFTMKFNPELFAERELDILLKTYPDPDNPAIVAPFVKEILALVRKFSKSGQSGGSAPSTAAALTDTIKKLCLYKPICDLTGLDEEWVEVVEQTGVPSLFQNIRCGQMFKEGKDGCPYYLDAVVFKEGDDQFTSNPGVFRSDGSHIPSSLYIKTFPFKPKTFYIDVIQKKVNDDYELYVRNEKQLGAVFKYYSLEPGY